MRDEKRCYDYSPSSTLRQVDTLPSYTHNHVLQHRVHVLYRAYECRIYIRECCNCRMTSINVTCLLDVNTSYCSLANPESGGHIAWGLQPTVQVLQVPTEAIN